jgi:hypothetical protein
LTKSTIELQAGRLAFGFSAQGLIATMSRRAAAIGLWSKTGRRCTIVNKNIDGIG